MTRKRFQKLNRALLAVSGKDTKETGMMRVLYADKIMPEVGGSYDDEWFYLNFLGYNRYGVGAKRRRRNERD